MNTDTFTAATGHYNCTCALGWCPGAGNTTQRTNPDSWAYRTFTDAILKAPTLFDHDTITITWDSKDITWTEDDNGEPTLHWTP